MLLIYLLNVMQLKPDGGVFITATDTGVGKTYISTSILKSLKEAGIEAYGFKPFASGSYSDSRKLQRFSYKKLSLEVITPFYFEKPLAPYSHFFLGTGYKVDIKKLEYIFKFDGFKIIEGIGGVYVPITKRIFLLDVIKFFNFPVILVAGNRLGCINHTILTYRELINNGIKINKVVLNTFKKIPPELEYTNIKVLSRFFDVDSVGYKERILFSKIKLWL